MLFLMCNVIIDVKYFLQVRKFSIGLYNQVDILFRNLYKRNATLKMCYSFKFEMRTLA